MLRLLSRAPNPCAILEAQPDLVDPVSLSRCLAALAQVGRGGVGVWIRYMEVWVLPVPGCLASQAQVGVWCLFVQGSRVKQVGNTGTR